MKYVRIALLPLAFLCVGLIRLFWRLGFRVRIGTFMSNRLGHFAGNTECYLCEKDSNTLKFFDIWVHEGEICNKQLAEMWGRVLHVDKTKFFKLVALCNTMFDGWEKYVAQSSQLDRDIYNLFEKTPPHLSFTDREEEYGYNCLKRMGIPHGSKWVCLIVRDEVKHTHLPYHSYRNADIDTYTEACLALANRGYYVIRMGKKVSKALPITHPKIIDLASMGQTDFMAVYLGAKCEFYISTGTGPDAIPYIFRRPIVYTNYVPFEYFFTFAPSLAIWKHHEKVDANGLGKRMSPKEIVEADAGQFMSAEDYERAGIKLVDNSPEEIKTVVLEMVTGSSIDPQDDFWASYPRSKSPFNHAPLHGEIRMRIGSEFLKGYQSKEKQNAEAVA